MDQNHEQFDCNTEYTVNIDGGDPSAAGLPTEPSDAPEGTENEEGTPAETPRAPVSPAHNNLFDEGHKPLLNPYLIPRVLRTSTMSMVSASPNGLKTWTALDLARAVITGSSWLGFEPAKQGAVMLILRDSTPSDVASQFRRLTQAFADGGIENRALLRDLHFVYDGEFDLFVEREWEKNTDGEWVHTRDAQQIDKLIEAANNFTHVTRTWAGGAPRKPQVDRLITFGEYEGFYELVNTDVAPEYEYDAEGVPTEKEQPSLGLDPAHKGVQLIIIDSLSTCSTANENDATEVRKVTKQLRRIAEETKALVIVLHHERKAVQGAARSNDMDMARGSSVLTAAFDSQFTLVAASAPGQTPRVHITNPKLRGMKFEGLNAELQLTGDPERDNEYALGFWNEIELNNDLARHVGGEEATYDPEVLYEQHAPWAYARATLTTRRGAPEDLVPILKHIIEVGGTCPTPDLSLWALNDTTSGFVANDSDSAKVRMDKAKNWVVKRMDRARKGGWIEPAAVSGNGKYMVSAISHEFYGAQPSIPASVLTRAKDRAAAAADEDAATDSDE